jgi:hypothetical protein
MSAEEMSPSSDYMSPLAFTTSSDPDVLYYHEAMVAPDKQNFITAMEQEIEGQTKNGNWEIVERSSLAPGVRVLPAVWAMRRKRRILDGVIYKWKARLNIDGGKQIKGIDYWDTYAPVTTWSTIRLILVISIINGWELKQLDFVQAFPQAPVESELYMDLPKGYIVNGERNNHALKLLRNVYGQKQAGRVWNEFLIKGLKEIGFVQSQHDMCMLWRSSCIIVIYTDDTIVAGLNMEAVDKAILDIGNKFVITSSLSVDDFLGVHLQFDKAENSISFTQPQLIKSIIKDLGLDHNSKPRRTPTVSNVILHAHHGSPPHNEAWHYRSVIGKLNYIEKSTRPDISFAVHQCARFCESPTIEHTAAVKRIGRYLLSSVDKGITSIPNNTSIQCYTDASFLGEWERERSDDPVTARSRTGYILMYANCPIIWASKLQTEIAHSATEAEYIALSQSLKEVTAMMYLLQELKDASFELNIDIPKVQCKVFEDNTGAIEMARLPKMRPRTKHLNAKYHHFREAVADGRIIIEYISTKHQLADILTKAVIIVLFELLRRGIQGW